MPRKKLIRQNTFPYHITTRTNNKAWFELPIQEVWKICVDSLIYSTSLYPVEIHAFVLMSNHYHLLVTTPNDDIDLFMRAFNLKLSQEISKRTGIINHKFSNRYKWSIVDSKSYLFNVYRYIYQNPVRAGITKTCISYPYSSLHLGEPYRESICLDPHFSYDDLKDFFETIYTEELSNVIRHALRKSYFQPANSTSRFNMNILGGCNFM